MSLGTRDWRVMGPKAVAIRGKGVPSGSFHHSVEMRKFVLAGECEVVSTIMQTHAWSSVSTGPGEPLRSWLGWTPLLRTPSSGVWLFRGALREEQLLAALVSTVDWVARGT